MTEDKTALIEEARREHEPMPSVVYPGVTWCAAEESAYWPCVASRLADALESLLAENAWLRAQQDDALAVVREALQSEGGLGDLEALLDVERVLSRTEDGTDG